jgi:hypothetical protein
LVLKFRFSYPLFIAALPPPGTFLPRSPQMIMNRQLPTMVHMTQTVVRAGCHSTLHTVFTSSASRPRVMLATLGYRQHPQAALQ